MIPLFPSPHSGILFLSVNNFTITSEDGHVSVPSFGDSFFIPDYKDMSIEQIREVSVPSFGDSFFMVEDNKSNILDTAAVSVPSFGDSFFILPGILLSSRL